MAPIADRMFQLLDGAFIAAFNLSEWIVCGAFAFSIWGSVWFATPVCDLHSVIEIAVVEAAAGRFPERPFNHLVVNFLPVESLITSSADSCVNYWAIVFLVVFERN